MPEYVIVTRETIVYTQIATVEEIEERSGLRLSDFDDVEALVIAARDDGAPFFSEWLERNADVEFSSLEVWEP